MSGSVVEGSAVVIGVYARLCGPGLMVASVAGRPCGSAETIVPGPRSCGDPAAAIILRQEAAAHGDIPRLPLPAELPPWYAMLAGGCAQRGDETTHWCASAVRPTPQQWRATNATKEASTPTPVDGVIDAGVTEPRLRRQESNEERMERMVPGLGLRSKA